MPKVVNGTPISILRYGLDNKKHSLVSFDYRDNKKEFKIKSSYIDRLNVIIETNKRNIPIGSEVYHNLLFYLNQIHLNLYEASYKHIFWLYRERFHIHL